jgi:3alpha(or 20beta)-hydroxysteroid dehydrogenase
LGRLERKVGLVTGGARGMGASHARALVREGAKVLVTDFDEAGAAQVAEEVGERALSARLDVTCANEWKRAVATAIDAFGRLDILINNAGRFSAGALGEYGREEWDETLAVNLTGPFLGISTALPALRRSSGASVINVSSPAGLQGRPRMHAYSASKFGLRGLTKSAALELAPWKIRVNSIHPGSIRTAMLPDFASEDEFAASIPLARIGEPEEISMLVVFLASDESSYITGAEFVADGGRGAGPHRMPGET